jgi:hypothetical protein
MPYMSVTDEQNKLMEWIDNLPVLGMQTIGQVGVPMQAFSLILMGAVKRSLSLASGLHSMVREQNMICARALLRMQLDTVSRVLAYTYVEDANAMARAVIGGKQLKKFKSTCGNLLVDKYLIDRMSKDHPWVRDVYDHTSGYVHFSEKQCFDSVSSIDESERRVQFEVGRTDTKFPDSSWIEILACFCHLLEMLKQILLTHTTDREVRLSSHC